MPRVPRDATTRRVHRGISESNRIGNLGSARHAFTRSARMLRLRLSPHRYTLPLKRLPLFTPARTMASAAPERFGNFDLIKRFKLSFTDVTGRSFALSCARSGNRSSSVSKWRSRVTGLSICHLDYEGSWPVRKKNQSSHRLIAPIVNGYFTVATESVALSLPFPKPRLIHPPQSSTIVDARIRSNSRIQARSASPLFDPS